MKNRMASKKQKTESISVEVVELDPKDLFMTTHLGDGSLGKTKFSASLTLPNMSMVVSVGERRYKVDSQKLISAMVEHHEKSV